MKIITLVGRPNSGKTSSIKMLSNEMLRMSRQSGQPNVLFNYPKQCQRSCIDQTKLNLCNGDLLQYKGDITIKFEWKGKTIGITSFGDDVSSIKTKFEIFKDCDIFLSAAHPDDDTMKYINLIAKGNTHILIYKGTVKSLVLPPNKIAAKLEETYNYSNAKEILDIIEYLL